MSACLLISAIFARVVVDRRAATIGALCVCVCISGCSGRPFSAELDAELLEMLRLDQGVRTRFMAKIEAEGLEFLSTEEFQALAAEQLEVDEANYIRLEEIFAQYGWPGPGLVSAEASDAAWLILQHADIERQRKFLPQLRLEVDEGRALPSNLAYVEDEVSLADTGEQIFGTEISIEDDRVFVPPVVDPANLDQRRADVGLPPMAAYLERAESEIGRVVDRSGLLME